MELRLLNSFVLAAKTLNFSKAADMQCINQSSFSQNIRQLEDELGVALFYRNSHEVSLTEAGAEFLPFAQKTLQQVADGKSRIDDLRNLKLGMLNIGVTHSFGLLIDEALCRFHTDYPSVKVNLFYKTAQDMPQMLADRVIDMALTFRPMDDNGLIESHTLFEDRLAIIVSERHVLAAVDHPRLECLGRHALVLPAHGLNARTVFDSMAEKYRLRLDACIEIDQVAPLIRLVGSGRFATVLSSSAVENVPGLVALPIDLPEARVFGSVHVLRDSYQKVAGRVFVEMLVETSAIRNRLIAWSKR